MLSKRNILLQIHSCHKKKYGFSYEHLLRSFQGLDENRYMNLLSVCSKSIIWLYQAVYWTEAKDQVLREWCHTFYKQKEMIIYKLETLYILTFGLVSHGKTVNITENFTNFFNKVGNENLNW